MNYEGCPLKDYSLSPLFHQEVLKGVKQAHIDHSAAAVLVEEALQLPGGEHPTVQV